MRYIGDTQDLGLLTSALHKIYAVDPTGQHVVAMDLQQPNGGACLIVPLSEAFGAPESGCYRAALHTAESLAKRIEWITQHPPTKFQILLNRYRGRIRGTADRLKGLFYSITQKEFEPLISLSQPLHELTDRNELRYALRTLTKLAGEGDPSVYVSRPSALYREDIFLASIKYLDMLRVCGIDAPPFYNAKDIARRIKESKRD